VQKPCQVGRFREELWKCINPGILFIDPLSINENILQKSAKYFKPSKTENREQ
jgi:hypothetical protein